MTFFEQLGCSPLINLCFCSYSYEGDVYSPDLQSNSSFNFFNPQNFSGITQDLASEFGHVYSPNSVILFLVILTSLPQSDKGRKTLAITFFEKPKKFTGVEHRCQLDRHHLFRRLPERDAPVVRWTRRRRLPHI